MTQQVIGAMTARNRELLQPILDSFAAEEGFDFGSFLSFLAGLPTIGDVDLQRLVVLHANDVVATFDGHNEEGVEYSYVAAEALVRSIGCAPEQNFGVSLGHDNPAMLSMFVTTYAQLQHEEEGVDLSNVVPFFSGGAVR